MKTKKGIYWNLKESDIIAQVDGLTFYFSSKFYRDKFVRDYKQFITFESLKLFNRYKVPLNFDLFLLLAKYKNTEKRGFRVEVDNEAIRSTDVIITNFLRS